MVATHVEFGLEVLHTVQKLVKLEVSGRHSRQSEFVQAEQDPPLLRL